MRYIKENYVTEIVINKSRFIGQLFAVNNINEVDNILKEIRKKYFDATHNCYAYILGNNQEIQKCSDDGEPQKTAGAPILDCLKKKELTNVLVIVTRYFGGILLGAGGLVRAYSQSTSSVCDLAKYFILENRLETTLPLSYKNYNILLNYDYINISNVSFYNDVIVTININENDKSKFLDDINKILKLDIDISFKKVKELIEEKA